MKLESSKLRRVLCALDVDRSGSTALAMASLLGERFQASVDALYAPPAEEHSAQERLSALVASATRKVSVT